ncbi:virion structural protein [Synechococcus phage ACG-2014h]|uniref:Virion structural protein n=1 Tax=Synechococcus phage ACG-2014h TaxID=1340810 RepID=V5UT29_9CAUD|nr:virion structural protein [Synechococcus phage ACG-2014h]AHB80495.1 hypothetical protein S-MbCM7_081 [Synechococcus phage ACG-2014h]
MPAINVARTDTFEQQRLKINDISTQIFDVTSGGSNLATGELKIGDGTRVTPSLAFTSDSSLGIFKADTGTLGIVSAGKNLFDYAPLEVISYRDIKVRKKILVQSGLTVVNQGQNYDTGNYSSVILTGGSGEGATADIVVLEFKGTVTNTGANYAAGSYAAQPFVSSGSPTLGMFADFDVDGIIGDIVEGSAYVPGTYTDVPITGGSGTGAEATITITGNTQYPGTISNAGSGYPDGVYTFVQAFNTPTQTFAVSTVANGGTPPPAEIFQIDGQNQAVLNLVVGNTYRFDQSDASNTGHPLMFNDSVGSFLPAEYIMLSNGTPGSAGAFADIIVLPEATVGTVIQYNCSVHAGMGATINIVSGTAGSYGYGTSYDITITSGSATGIITASGGIGYQAGDVVNFPNSFLGGAGTGLEFTLSGPVYDGEVTAVVFTDNGQNYVTGNILSAADSDLGGGGGSGFSYTVTSNPGKIDAITISSYGTDHAVGDIQTLPVAVSSISSTLPGQVNGASATLTGSSAVVAMTTTAGINPGMNIYTDAGSTGDAGSGTLTVQTVDNATQITMSGPAITGGAATLTFVSPLGLSTIEVADASGIFGGYTVSKVSGAGVLADDTTVSSVDLTTTPNQIVLSASPTTPGAAVLDFAPPFGVGTTPFAFTIDALGVIDDTVFTLSDDGNGYNIGDSLSVDASSLTQPIIYTLTTQPTQLITFSSAVTSSAISVGDVVKVADGVPQSVSGAGSTILAEASAVYSGITVFTTSGNGQGGTIDISRDSAGDVSTVIFTGGLFYADTDTCTIGGNLVGGASPADDVTVTINGASLSTDAEVYVVNTAGGNIANIITYAAGFADAESIIVGATTASYGTTEYTINTAGTTRNKFFLDIGSGPQMHPDLTFYVGNKYQIDTSDASNNVHTFAFSALPGGSKAPSLVESVSTTLDSTSTQITVTSSAGIVAGMTVTETGTGAGELAINTTVESVDNATTITLSDAPLVSGLVTLTFAGNEYTDGVIRNQNDVEITVTANTPTTLYYYNSINDPENAESGGDIGSEATITSDPNNPKVFGSGFEVTVTQTQVSDTIRQDVDTGTITLVEVVSQQLSSSAANISGTLTAPRIDGGDIEVTNLTNITTNTITLNTSNVNVSADLAVGSAFTVAESTGNLTIGGTFVTTNTININSELVLENNEVRSVTSDLVLEPATGRVVKVEGTTAINIPAGDTSERPGAAAVGNGSIRFNTQTNQYEGYSATSQAWSSLGGVRDLDGNTYIIAEQTIGSNDNTLWFYNDAINTVKFGPTKLEFVTNKKIQSPAVNAPAYQTWTANTPVTIGQYVKWLNNLYEVTVAGTTGTSGNEPIHTTGNQLNGTAILTWSQLAVAPLTFEEIEEVRIGPDAACPVVINSELRLADNTISTDVSDLVIRPNAGKKLTIDAASSIVIPVGTDGERGVQAQGSIRFNTSATQFEGYDGSNWGSLGGVKDVDQNTYIIPETSPGANENVLYFYNDGNNTLRLTTTELQFDTVDTIVSSTSDEFEITASLMTFDGAATTLDNTAVDTTFLHGSKQYFDIGLSSGLFVEPVLRLDNQGDVYLNTGFGTGTINQVKVFDGDLREFELNDIKILTDKVSLTQGTVNNTNSILYPTATAMGAKTVIVAHNTTSNEKEFIEFGITDDNTNVFHTEYGNVRTGTQLIVPTFEVTGSNEVRLNIAIGSNVPTTETVNITVTSTITKK